MIFFLIALLAATLCFGVGALAGMAWHQQFMNGRSRQQSAKQLELNIRERALQTDMAPRNESDRREQV